MCKCVWFPSSKRMLGLRPEVRNKRQFRARRTLIDGGKPRNEDSNKFKFSLLSSSYEFRDTQIKASNTYFKRNLLFTFNRVQSLRTLYWNVSLESKLIDLVFWHLVALNLEPDRRRWMHKMCWLGSCSSLKLVRILFCHLDFRPISVAISLAKCWLILS